MALGVPGSVAIAAPTIYFGTLKFIEFTAERSYLADVPFGAGVLTGILGVLTAMKFVLHFDPPLPDLFLNPNTPPLMPGDQATGTFGASISAGW